MLNQFLPYFGLFPYLTVLDFSLKNFPKFTSENFYLTSDVCKGYMLANKRYRITCIHFHLCLLQHEQVSLSVILTDRNYLLHYYTRLYNGSTYIHGMGAFEHYITRLPHIRHYQLILSTIHEVFSFFV